jgi:predicted enzyme related to lactoylglutathione lyase
VTIRPFSRLFSLALSVALAASGDAAPPDSGSQGPHLAVAPQYDSTHVYVAPEDFDRFVALMTTFGGTASKQGVFQVTPTPSETLSQSVRTPVGTVSVFGFKTPVPYPFGLERTGYLVTNLDAAVKSARDNGADVIVETFSDPIGRDAIVEFPGGVHMQFYVHTIAPDYPALKTVPENRVYVSSGKIESFIRAFAGLSRGRVVSDVAAAPGLEIGRPNDTYRRVRLESDFGTITAFVTDGHLPYPYGREMTGYEVADLDATLTKAKSAGVDVLIAPYTAEDRKETIVRFPGGYIAEIHAAWTR